MRVCENGHIVSRQSSVLDINPSQHCEDCGAAIWESCPNCDIPFTDPIAGSPNWTEATLPDNCSECGSKYPWGESNENKSGNGDQVVKQEYNIGSVNNLQSGVNTTQYLENSFNDIKEQASSPDVVRRLENIEKELNSRQPDKEKIEEDMHWMWKESPQLVLSLAQVLLQLL
jgi:hypothetical protein